MDGNDKCTCGEKEGICKSQEHDGQPRVTWRDRYGRLHINGMGLILDAY